MTTYAVIEKLTQTEVYRYQNDTPVEWEGWEFATHDHVPLPDEAAPEAPPREIVWTKLVFQRRFTDEERIAFRARAKTDPYAEDFNELLRVADDVRSTDPDVLRGLNYLTQVGILAEGRAQEILNG